MLEKLAKQTAVYGISTIAVRFLSYLLTPVFTRVFEPEAYGIVTDVYALIPFALVVLTMGLESAYFRFAAKADAAAAAAGGTEGEIAARARAGKRRLFATAWGVTLLAASLFFLLTAFGRERVAEWMGEAYVAHPEYVLLVAAVVWFDVAACLPFSRLREQGRAMTFVGIKALGVVVNVALAIGFALAGLYGTPFGVGWVFVANLIASAVTFNVILLTTDRTVPRIDRRLLAAVLVYSLPLLVSGVAGTANEFIDRQMIKYLVPAGAMAQLGVYGAITKIAVVMMLFTQMYRLAAEPFFLADYRKSDFVAMNAAAMKYYVMASMFIFLGIALFKDLFSLIVGADFRDLHPAGGAGGQCPERRVAEPLVLVQARGADAAGRVGHLHGVVLHCRDERGARSGAGLRGRGVGAARERSGDGRGELLAQPALLPHALRPAPYRRVCRAGAGRFLRQCGFRALAPRARRGICGERRVVRSVRPVRRAARAYRRRAAVAIGRETMN